jgi:site-specific recombinase XerD
VFPESELSAHWLVRLKQHIRQERYSSAIARKYPNHVRRFFCDLECRGQALESVTSTDVEHYLDRQKHQRDRRTLSSFMRKEARAAIKMLLRLVHNGTWPLKSAPEPATADELAVQEVVNDYNLWMRDVRGLSEGTREHRRLEVHLLLRWLRDHGKNIATLCLADLDAYIASRVSGMRRCSKVMMLAKLRSVLRYLHHSGRIPADLAGAIEAPPVYTLEHIPSTIRPEEIDRILATTREDQSPLGRRDWAILSLLTTYGLRCGEVIGLRLTDIDWRNERLRIRHTKTGAYSDLPLLRDPADALLDYLKYARPETALREVFLRARAPYRALTHASLRHVMARRLQAAGVSLPGKHGPHVFRHSRAASLLNGGTSIKMIGDILGHRSSKSTAIYLKLANDDLRAIALDLPQEVPA